MKTKRLSPLFAEQAPPPPAIVRSGEPTNIRYSDFIKSIKGDKLEKVTFSSDGSRLLAIDTDGQRLKIDALPNDPELLSMLTQHKVDVTVLPAQQASGAGELAQSLIFPAVLFAGLFFLSRRAGGGTGGGGGGPGGMGGGEFVSIQ